MPPPPFKEEGVYCVLMLVGLSVDHTVYTDYLENYLSQSFHISHIDWSWLVDDPYPFWDH